MHAYGFLSSMYFPSISVFYMYDSYLRNALVSNIWKCHGEKKSTATDFVLNSGNRMKLHSANERTLWDRSCFLQETAKLEFCGLVDISVIFFQ